MVEPVQHQPGFDRDRTRFTVKLSNLIQILAGIDNQGRADGLSSEERVASESLDSESDGFFDSLTEFEAGIISRRSIDDPR